MDGSASQSLRRTTASDFVFAGGFRHVTPYLHLYTSEVNHIWAGRTVINAFCTFFTAYSREYFLNAIEHGWLRVNGEIPSPDHVLVQGEELTHLVHRHEPPVLDWTPTVTTTPILSSGDDGAGTPYGSQGLTLVCKPPSWPMYPTGAYRKATLLHILEGEHGTCPRHLLYRLDRLTSGLVMLANTPEDARAFAKASKRGELAKMYLARVVGRMDAQSVSSACGDDPDVCVTPIGGMPADTWLEALEREGLLMGAWAREHVVPRGAGAAAEERTSGSAWAALLPPVAIRCTHPIRLIPGKRGRFEAGRHVRHAGTGEGAGGGVAGPEASKEATSMFYPLAYDGGSNTTLVLAQAVTGRTHQLRVHLQGMGSPRDGDAGWHVHAGGWPVGNDPVYGLAGRTGHPHYDTWVQCATSDSGRVPSVAHPDALPELARRVQADPCTGATVSASTLARMAGRQEGDGQQGNEVDAAARQVAREVIAACPWCSSASSATARSGETLGCGNAEGVILSAGAQNAGPLAAQHTEEEEAGEGGADGPDMPKGVSAGFRSCIWLHATCYTHRGSGAAYTVPPPTWAAGGIAAAFVS